MLTDGDQKFVTSQFLNVGNAEGEIDLQSLKVPAGEDAIGEVTLTALGGSGETVGFYVWFYFDDDEACGWADAGAGYKKAEMSFAPGSSFWVQNNLEEDAGLQSAGQVSNASINFELLTDGDQCAVGNPFPVDIKLSDITLDLYEDAIGEVTLTTLGGSGETVGFYVWFYFDDDGSFGWADAAAGYKKADVTLKPGEGAWVQNNLEDVVTLTIDAPASLKDL